MDRIRLYLSTEHPCGYLPQRTARSLFIDPDYELNPRRYEMLLEQGFRRGGDHVYRPRCEACQLCIPARVPLRSFEPNRAQRRCLARNEDLTFNIGGELTDEQFDLYQRYLRVRHSGGGMNPDDKPGFHNFLDCGWGHAEFWEFRLDSQLIACAVVDRVPNALSAVYTFFDPEQSVRSLGTYAVLRQIREAQQLGMRYLYLGYWVPGSEKMDYKRQYRPLELLRPSGWQLLETAAG